MVDGNKLCFFSSVLLLTASLRVHLSIASDSIFPGQSLSGNQTLISHDGLFELGFFTPGNSSHNYYIGTWFRKGSYEKKRVVWVANRDKPLNEPSSSELKLVEYGNLVLFDQFQIPVWSTNSSSNTLNSSLLVLGDDGNLVLRYRTNPSNVIWQSFDHPTDTWLPGQRLGVNRATGLARIFTSWKSPDDPSPGNYSLQLDPNGRAQYLILWNGFRRYWLSGEWNGQIFGEIPEMRARPFTHNMNYVSNERERYFTYNLYNHSTPGMFVIDPSGEFRIIISINSNQSWEVFWAQPRRQCNVYNYCGVFSSCNPNDSSSCACLPGFQLLRDWAENSYKCSRRIQLQCGNRTVNGETDKFLKIPQTQFPVDQHSSPIGTAQECESSCLQNCACTAYAYNDGVCLTWIGDLLNVQPLSQGDIGGGDLYLKVAASESDIIERNDTLSSERNGTTISDSNNKNNRRLRLTITLPIVLTTLALGFIACWLWRRKLAQKEGIQRSRDLLLFDTRIDSESHDPAELLEGEKKDVDLLRFSFASVSAATSNFSIANKLGEGGFGPVYKGTLKNRQEVAVKRLSKSSGQGLQELENEALLIVKLQHRNLVRLLGCCIEGGENILVYEYMPNKSLDSFIFDPIKCYELDWERRVHIIEGIAQGLLYLHQYSRLHIIHRDMKPSNILLDGELNPKISDFGMARIFGGNDSQGSTNRIVGTFGYMPPEYAKKGHFSVKSDVFSFGVLVLEIVSGKKNTGFHLSDSRNLLDHAWNLWKSKRGLELLDQVLGKPSSFPTPLRYIHVGLLCVQEDSVDRPTMSDVLGMLSNESMILPSPKRPAYVTERFVMDESSNVNMPAMFSSNTMTVSILHDKRRKEKEKRRKTELCMKITMRGKKREKGKMGFKEGLDFCPSKSEGQSLSGNQTLISKGGFFELGFFTPGNNSQNHYIGIWYKRGSNETKRVVWVANRDSPLSEPSSSELRFVEDGNLVLFNQLQNSVVWSTNSTSNTLNSSLVVLGDDGNLVIRSRRDPFSVSWQSFDYPTDTWLPGQKFGVNKVTGLSHILTSWKSPDDPSPGNYSLELDRNGRAQYFIMWNGRRYWASGEWNGQVFSSIPEMRLGSGLYNLSYVPNETEGYFIYNLLEDSISMKFALDPSGQFRLSGWMDNDPSWRFLWAQPREQCNVYNYCGAFSRCNQNDSSSCGCLPGFQLVRDWVENNYRCSRRIQLQCVNRTVIGETDKFLRIPQTTFPVDQQSSLVTTQGCESACLQNCSCTAYAYNNGQCSIWAGDLLNVQPLSQGDIGGGDLYLKVAASEMGIPEENTTTSTERNETSTPERQLSLIIALPIALTVLVSSFLACLLWKRKLIQKGERQRSQDLLLFDIAIQSETRDATVSLKGEKEDADLPLFSFC